MIRPVFDDPNLVSAAGVEPVSLAESAGFHGLLDDRLSVASPNAMMKAAGVVGGMLSGADSIDDLEVLRHGGIERLFAGLRAPSMLGTFLRSPRPARHTSPPQVHRRTRHPTRSAIA